MTLQEEIQRRRTFAIISHPDAGKTTLTEDVYKRQLCSRAQHKMHVFPLGKRRTRACRSRESNEKGRGLKRMGWTEYLFYPNYCFCALYFYPEKESAMVR